MKSSRRSERFCTGVAIVLVSLAALSASSIATAQTTRAVPSVSGDQLVYFYDARTDRTPFLGVSNPSNTTIFVDVAFFDVGLTMKLASSVIELGPAANTIIDPTSFAGGGASGNAGLAFITPVASLEDLRPVVPPSELTGGFTLANLNLGSGFGQNPLSRVAVDGAGMRQEPGTLVDGSSVFYERFQPAVLVIPAYFDPNTLAPPEDDGNRILLAAFSDFYSDSGFSVNPIDTNPRAVYFDNEGTQIVDTEVNVNGVLLSNLEEVAGDVDIGGASGKVFFGADTELGNFFGLFSQSVGTFAAAQRLPAVDSIPQSPGPGGNCTGSSGTIVVQGDESVYDACIRPEAGDPTICDVDIGFDFAVQGCERTEILSNELSGEGASCDESRRAVQAFFGQSGVSSLPTGGPYMVLDSPSLTCFGSRLSAAVSPSSFRLSGEQTLTIRVE